MKKRLLIAVIVILYITGIIISINWVNSHFLSDEENVQAVLDYNYNRTFSGVIIEKFIDKNEHNYKKVIIIENGIERTLYFDFESGGLFNFFSINDTIIKSKGNLKVQIKRNQKDTTINMKFLYMSVDEFNENR